MIDAVSSVASAAAKAAPARTDTNFADALGTMGADMAASINNAEVVSARGLTGDASVRQVAEAVMDAERSLQTAVAMRDKVVAAWLDISRMAI